MFSYFSVFDKNMMHFFSWTLLIGLPVYPWAGRTPGGRFFPVVVMKPTHMFGFIGREILGKEKKKKQRAITYELLWLNRRAVSFFSLTASLISHRLGS